MKRILHKLKISEVSLVDRPANKLARVAIMKRDGDDMTETEQEYLSDASPKEKATYLAASPAERKRILAQDAADDADEAGTAKRGKITKAEAEMEWCEARDAYLRVPSRSW